MIERRQRPRGPGTAGRDAYFMASNTVRLLNQAIDEETDPAKRADMRSALEDAQAMEDALARALEAETAARQSRDS